VREWDRKVEKFASAVKPYLVPGITASRYVKTFTFTTSDWKRLRDEGRDAFILVLHREKERLSQRMSDGVRQSARQKLEGREVAAEYVVKPKRAEPGKK
jgi:hypothetical protein